MTMRTTLDIDDDILAAAKEIARLKRLSTGKVISGLLRDALAGRGSQRAGPESRAAAPGGFRPFPPRETPVTNALIDELRDREGV